MIQSSTVLEVLIRYGLDNMQVNWETTVRIINILKGWLERHDNSRAVQNRLGELGTPRLILKLLSSKPPSKVVAAAVQLSIAILDGGNEYIQGLFQRIFDTIDDAACFAELTNAYTKVLGNLKRYRAIQKSIINNEYLDDVDLAAFGAGAGRGDQFKAGEQSSGITHHSHAESVYF